MLPSKRIGFARAMVLTCMLLPRCAQAAFINGVETFDGTTLDLSTWERYDPNFTTFSQNNALTISGSGSYADYTTRTLSVGVGQRISAQIALTAPNEASTRYSAELLLTSNSTGTTKDTRFDTYFVGGGITFDSTGQAPAQYFSLWEGSAGSYDAGPMGSAVPVSGSPYVISVTRLSARDFMVSAMQTDGSVLESLAFTSGAPAPPDQLFISLHRTDLRFFENDIASFDNVTVMSIPEPSTTSAALLCSALFCMRCSISLGRMHYARAKKKVEFP